MNAFHENLETPVAAGAVWPPGNHADFWTAEICMGAHSAAIEIHGETQAIVERRRDIILRALQNAPNESTT